MKIMDIRGMPEFNPIIKNGVESVSKNKVRLAPTTLMTECKVAYHRIDHVAYYPTCREHGAMLKVSKEGIWRCPTCNEGCYVQSNTL